MILALDTDVVIHWFMDGSTHHDRVVSFLQAELSIAGRKIAIVPQVLHEFLHVSTDTRRFENPLTLSAAAAMSRTLWEAREVIRIIPDTTVFPRTLELLREFKLGRKRILDTSLAATLERAGVSRLSTFNVRDYQVFPFLDPGSPLGHS